ncbi:unnamed protein product [Closterium sp. NIES-53]
MHRSMWEIPVLPWKEAAARLAAEVVRGGHASHVTSGGGGDGSDGGLLVHWGGVLPSVTPSTGETDWFTAHRRFGHVALPQLQQLFTEERVKGLRIKGEPKEVGSCDTCLTSKFSRVPFHSAVGQSSDPVELVHVDLVGPMKVKEDGGALYSMTMVDDYTRLTWSFPLGKKSDAARFIIEEWLPMVERESGKRVKAIRSDRGEEFLGAEFRSWLKWHGIKQQLTTAYTAQSNGVAERANRTIIEGGRTILVDSGLPLRFWPLAIRHATVIKNRVLTHVGGQDWVPMEKWSGKKPLVDMLRVFGCMGLVHVPKEKRDKLQAVAVWAVHLVHGGAHVQGVVERGRSKVTIPLGIEVGTNDPLLIPIELSSSSELTEVSHDLGGAQWEAADVEEVLQQGEAPVAERGDTEEEVQQPIPSPKLPPRRTTQEKRDAVRDGTKEGAAKERPKRAAHPRDFLKLERRKTRLVIKGFEQREGIDFQEVFSLVAKAPTLWLLLAAAGDCGWKVEQMDVKTVFLYGVVDEDIYMRQPEGYDDGSGRVCRLNKAICGLKQALRCWYARLVEALEALGFKVSECDESLFMTEGEEEKVFLLVYVDDILLFSPSLERIKKVQGKLKETFQCKALGPVGYYLGLPVERDEMKGWLRLHQHKYLAAMGEKYGLEEGRSVKTPLPSGFQLHLDEEEGEVLEYELQRRFQSMVESLMYASVNTRPGIAFSVSQLARVVSRPLQEHLDVAERLVRFCMATSRVGLQYSVHRQLKRKGVEEVSTKTGATARRGHLYLSYFTDATWASGPSGSGGMRGAGVAGRDVAGGSAPLSSVSTPAKDDVKAFNLEKFSGEDWASWSFRMELLFNHYGLLEVMDGELKRPASEGATNEWDRRSKDGFFLLSQCLSSNQLHHVKYLIKDIQCGPKAWKILKDVHAPSSEAMVVVLERQLHAVKINEGDAVQGAFDQLRDLYVKLSAAGVDYPEKIKCYKALSLLPESWGPLVVNLNGMKVSWSLERIRAQVLYKEFWRKELTAAAGEGGGCAYGMKGFNGRGSKKGKAKEGSGGE